MKLRKSMTKIVVSLAVCFALMLTVFAPKAVEAAMADEALEYEWGNTVSDYIWGGNDYYTFTLTCKSVVYLQTTADDKFNGSKFYLYNSSGKQMAYADMRSTGYCTYNSTTEKYTYKKTLILPKGTYYANIDGNYLTYSFYATAEKYTALTKPSISLSKPAAGKIAVKMSKVSGRIGYQVMYSTKSSFKNAKTINTTALKKTISKLKKGKRYYVKARAYMIYGCGYKSYSAWSNVKTVVTKK